MLHVLSCRVKMLMVVVITLRVNQMIILVMMLLEIQPSPLDRLRQKSTFANLELFLALKSVYGGVRRGFEQPIEGHRWQLVGSLGDWHHQGLRMTIFRCRGSSVVMIVAIQWAALGPHAKYCLVLSIEGFVEGEVGVASASMVVSLAWILLAGCLLLLIMLLLLLLHLAVS